MQLNSHIRCPNNLVSLYYLKNIVQLQLNSNIRSTNYLVSLYYLKNIVQLQLNSNIRSTNYLVSLQNVPLDEQGSDQLHQIRELQFRIVIILRVFFRSLAPDNIAKQHFYTGTTSHIQYNDSLKIFDDKGVTEGSA